MARWFWYFFIYSLGGCGLEKLFALAIRSQRQQRKCFLLLPLCPVYGVAMVAVLAAAPDGAGFWVLAALGGMICTAVEFAVHWFYEKVFGVWFWDYSELPGHINGRICPQFAAAWGVLSAWAVGRLQPLVELAVAGIPPAVTFAAWEVFAVDCVCSAALLWRRHDIGLLSLPAVWASSHESTSA